MIYEGLSLADSFERLALRISLSCSFGMESNQFRVRTDGLQRNILPHRPRVPPAAPSSELRPGRRL